MDEHILEKEINETPEGYEGPNLSPVGLRLEPRFIGEGVYALMANIPPKDNSGLIFGSSAALVIDAGITGEIARQIQEIVAGITDRGLRYLVNTTYHGDHTFGNAGFSDELTVISSRANRDQMTDLAYEKMTRGRNMYGDEGLLDAVTTWRLPELVFDGYAEIDLGGRTVELHHFGAGNGPGDTVVYVPATRTAWTGNFLCREGVAHMLLQAGPGPYIESLRAMREALPEVSTIVPGHGPAGDYAEAITELIGYLERLRDEVAAAFEAGKPVEETIASCTNPWSDGLSKGLVEALATYNIPQDAARAGFLSLCRDLHKLNILTTYRVYEKNAGAMG